MLGFLWSINERLAGNDGRSLPEPDTRWLDDLMHIAIYEAEQEDGENNETKPEPGWGRDVGLLSD